MRNRIFSQKKLSHCSSTIWIPIIILRQALQDDSSSDRRSCVCRTLESQSVKLSSRLSHQINDGFSFNDDELWRAPGHDVKAGVHVTRVGGAEVSRSYDNHDRSLQSQDALRLGDLNEVRLLWSNKSVNTWSVAPFDDVDQHAPCLQTSDKAGRPLFWWCGTDVKVHGVAAVGTAGEAGHGVRRDVIKTVNVARDEHVAEPDGFLGLASGSCSNGNFAGGKK